jgi:hypothetical protein
MSPPGLDIFAIFMLICAENVRSDHPFINQTIVYRLLYVIFQVEGCLLPMCLQNSYRFTGLLTIYNYNSIYIYGEDFICWTSV